MLHKSDQFTPVQVFIKSMASEVTMGTNKAKNLSTSVEMRRKAEELLQVKTAKQPSPRTNEETQRLVHELEVHQIELEMQNEELRQIIAERDAILETYQELYDSSPAGYFNLDHVGIINEVNQTGAAFLRVERSLLTNNRLDAFITDETRLVFHDFLDKVFTNDTKKTCEVVFVKQDHSPLSVQIEAIVSETRKNCRAVVIDITERKQTENELAKAKLRLEALMAAVPVGISFSDDITCQHITGNPAVLEQFNVSTEDNLSASALDVHAPGRKVKFFLDGREISDAELPLQRAVSENRVIPPMELKVVMSSGKHWITRASGAPVRDTQGNIIGGISVTEDITELKQAEEALKQSHERKRMILEVSSIGTFEFDLLTGEGRWNSVMYDLLGLKSDISQGNPELFFQFVHPADVVKLKADWEKALETGTFDSEFRIVRTDGQERWLTGKGRFLYGEEINSRTTRFLGVNYDITARKKAEDALKRSEERHRVLSETMLQGVVHHDVDGKVISMNPAAERILGKSKEDLLGNTSVTEEHDTIRENGELFPGVEHPIMVSLRTGLPVRSAIMGVFNPKLDEYRWIGIDSVPVFRSGEKYPSEVYAVFGDITERKQAENTLRENEARLRLAQESATVGIWDWNMDTGSLEFTPELSKLYGLPPGTIKSSQDWRDRVHPDDIGEVETRCDEAIAKHEPFDLEFRGLHTSGEYRWIAAKGGAIYDDAGTAVRVLGVNIDITELKRTHEALKTLNDELEDRVAQRTAELRRKDQAMIQQNSMAALGEMINNIAHQWRQPLNAISLIIQFVQSAYASGKLSGEEMNSNIQNVMENIMHMSQTIEDFRNFFKLNKVKQEFFISEAVRSAMSLVSASLEHHNIKVEIKTEDDATVIGYQNEYSQVLLNIISNTCDACTEHKVPRPRIFISIAHENERSVLYIRDNCGGIPDDIISKIFDPYFTTRGPDKGTGIGLYMSKMIIEQNMNGQLTVCNTDGGAEFRIEV